jgi:SAM-dependent methyltransferase
MKMTRFEKLFVNSPSHSQQVSWHAEKLLKLIEVRAGQKYLDLGCGNGAAPIYLAQKYPLDVTGIDIDPDQIRLAEQQSHGMNNVHFQTNDGRRLPFLEGAFDIVSTNKVMHHVPNWPEAIAEMIRVLKPGGYFIYADLIYPGWLAALGKMVLGRYAGFPTQPALDSLLAQYFLSPVHRSVSVFNYEVVYQKDQ